MLPFGEGLLDFMDGFVGEAVLLLLAQPAINKEEAIKKHKYDMRLVIE